MDRLELAERRYRDIVADNLPGMERGKRYWGMPTSKLLAWIDDYVVPAIEEVYQRPQFRDHATWPQRVLVKGADTPERAAVERVDRALVAEAKALCKLPRNRLVARALEEMTPRQEESETCSVTSSSGGSECVPLRLDPRRWIPYYVAQTDNMSRRDWTDLVCADDYFIPTGGMMRRTPLPEGVTEGAFVVSLSPHLFQVGDSITRCMMQRIRSMLGFLAEARQVIYRAVRATGRPYTSQVEAEREAYRELDQSHADLQRICLTGADARVREACITLVQVYAEFHPAATLDWLGISDWALRCFQGQLRHNIESTRELETVERIAAALGDVRHLYRGSSPELSDIEAAIATGNLVLIKAEQGTRPLRAQSFNGAARLKSRGPIEAPSGGIPLPDPRRTVRKSPTRRLDARIASPVNDIDLYEKHVSYSTMYNRWARLAPLLPPSLYRHVCGEAERATYRLDLPINKIHLFDSRRAGH